MALASELVATIADATGTDAGTLTRHARIAREAGLLSQSGRGRSAAQMRPIDAARLLACLLVAGEGKDAAAHISAAAEMHVSSRDADHLDERHLDGAIRERLMQDWPILFDREHTFLALLAELVATATKDWQAFDATFSDSWIYFFCDDFESIVDFSIFETANFSFSYVNPNTAPRSPHYRRCTQMSFHVLARIGRLLSTN